MSDSNLPSFLKPLLWSYDVPKMDLEKDKGLIVHQVLIYGNIEQIKWLFKTYGRPEIINIFLNKPSKNYPDYIFNFIKNYVLGLSQKVLDEQLYVTSIHGPLRLRAARGF